MATLLISIVLLIAITLVVLVSSQSVITQQRIIANEQRSVQAFEAAYAGLAYGLSYFQSNTADGNGDSTLDVLHSGNWEFVSGTSGPAYRVKFVDDVDVGNIRLVSIVAEGRSDDSSALSRMSVTVSGTPAVSEGPDNPVTARGVIGMTGSGTITNPEGSTTIWSGENVDFTAMASNTLIKHPSASGTIESSSASNKGPDIIDNDSNLSTLSDNDFFRNFFGLTPDNYRATIPGLDLTTADYTKAELKTELQNTPHRVIWLDGDIDLTGNLTLGTIAEPVVIIVDGDKFGAGNVEVNGLLFVTGDWSGSGSLEVNGASIVRGGMSGTGSLDVIYSSAALGNLGSAGKGAVMPGTWIDFGVTW